MAKTLLELVQEFRDKVEPTIGITPLSDINEYAADPMVQIVVNNLAGIQTLTESMEGCRQCLDIDSADCDTLKSLAKLMGQPINVSTPSVVSVFFVGVCAHVIPRGTVFLDRIGNQWKTTSAVTISSGGDNTDTGFTTAESDNGAYTVIDGELYLETADVNIKAATNTTQLVVGSTEETCDQLRARLQNLKPGWRVRESEAAVETALLALPEVTHVDFIGKAPTCLSATGASSPAFIVDGGDADAIAGVIKQSAPVNSELLVGNETGFTPAGVGIPILRRCPVGVKIKYCGNEIIEADIKRVMCQSGVTLSQDVFIGKIPGLRRIRFSVEYGKEGVMPTDCENTAAVTDCEGNTYDMINKGDCLCGQTECQDVEWLQYKDLERWEKPILIDMEQESC